MGRISAMKRSKAEAERVIKEITALLSDRALAERIDDPVEEVCERFSFDKKRQFSTPFFIETIGRFLQDVYKKALFVRKKLTSQRAGSEAIALLEKRYQGKSGAGFYAAVCDAKHGFPDSVGHVILSLAEYIKAEKRMHYTYYVYEKYIEIQRWDVKCMIAGVLLKRLECYLPDEFNWKKPARWGERVCDLMTLYLQSPRGMDKKTS